MPPKLGSDQANWGWRTWHPGLHLPLRGGRVFSFCKYFHHLTGGNDNDGLMPFNVQFPAKILSFATWLKLGRLSFVYIHPVSYILYLIPAILTYLVYFLGDWEDNKAWFSLSQYFCCWRQGISICRNKQTKCCEWTPRIPAHACGFSWHPRYNTWSGVTSRVLWTFWALLALRGGVCTAK